MEGYITLADYVTGMFVPAGRLIGMGSCWYVCGDRWRLGNGGGYVYSQGVEDVPLGLGGRRLILLYVCFFHRLR